jgi:Cu-processing system permease protein
MKTLFILARLEFLIGLRNRWVAATVLALLSLALVLALLGAAPSGGVKASLLSVNVLSLASLSIYLLPLIALLLSYDAVVGELDRGTLPLLLSYPVARLQVILGKFLGHLAILALASLAGYGGAALVIAGFGGADQEGVVALAGLIASSWLLGAVFLALGYLLSALAEERGRAAGLAVALWLFMVVLYDLGLLGLLLLDQDQSLPKSLFTGLLLANPTDAFRIFNLSLVEGLREAGGLAGLGVEALPSQSRLLGILCLWILGALALAGLRFRSMEV